MVFGEILGQLQLIGVICSDDIAGFSFKTKPN